jgi:hypothetical protein
MPQAFHSPQFHCSIVVPCGSEEGLGGLAGPMPLLELVAADPTQPGMRGRTGSPEEP